MSICRAHNSGISGIFFSCLLLCLASVPVAADEATVPASILSNSMLDGVSNDHSSAAQTSSPFPLVIDHSAGLNFDLGGIETRKLELQLTQPLTLTTGSSARILDNGSNILGLDATLNVPLNKNFNLSAGVDRQSSNARFQSLGSIQCMNGTLRADSYTASGCRFINEPLASTEQQRINLGAQMHVGNTSASINWFTQDSSIDQSTVQQSNRFGGQVGMGSSLLSPNLGNPMVSNSGYDPLQYLNSEASGINLNFKVGIATDTHGDLRVGLAFSRVLDSGYKGLYSYGNDAVSWTIAEPFNTAKMDVEWSQGAFSTGIQGFYRDSVNFLDRESVDSLTTFDVHFTWRTPWNANLSVGASNLLNAGQNNTSTTENQPVDPLESIYGRIPYVRYKQDL